MVDDLVPLDDGDNNNEQEDTLNLSTNTAVRKVITRNASFMSLTAGALATAQGGARSAMIAEAHSNVAKLKSI